MEDAGDLGTLNRTAPNSAAEIIPGVPGTQLSELCPM